MATPTSTAAAEEIILYYNVLRYQLLCGQITKIYIELGKRANELGMSLTRAWRLIRYGASIGMVDGRIKGK